MTDMEFRAKMLALAAEMGEALLQYAVDGGIEKEPETVSKCLSATLLLLTETEDFLNALNGSSSDTIISE